MNEILTRFPRMSLHRERKSESRRNSTRGEGKEESKLRNQLPFSVSDYHQLLVKPQKETWFSTWLFLI